MPVVTIRGLTGSGATEIGRQVAKLLRGDYVDREIIAQVAEVLKRPEEQVAAKEKIPPGVFDRIVLPLRRVLSSGSGEIESAYSRAWKEPLDDADYLSALEAVVRNLALDDNIVIVGRGSQHILRNHRSALHALVISPRKDRVNHVMERLQKSNEEAARYIDETDASHQAFVMRFFKKDIEDPQLYDLVVNTRYISYDAAAGLIVSASAAKNPWGNG